MTALSEPVRAGARPSPLLEVQDLQVAFRYDGSWKPVVHSASFTVHRNEVVGLVGESGSGKTVTAMATMGLVPALGGRVEGGTVRLTGTDVTSLTQREWADLRGARISMVFQQPIRSLNPAFTVGEQISETIRRHRGTGRKVAFRQAVELLERVHIARPAERATMYPHELSGGMCQRVMIAIALACQPELLVADEPTTALDVTVQRQVLELLQEIRSETGIGMLLITHDLGVIAQMCDRVAVMYAGEVVEDAHVLDLFRSPQHPYSDGLLSSLPRRGERFASIPGRVPAPTAMPRGCHFHPRCPHAVADVCTTAPLDLRTIRPDHLSRCARAEQLNLVPRT